jgi:hypothetical protein
LAVAFWAASGFAAGFELAAGVAVAGFGVPAGAGAAGPWVAPLLLRGVENFVAG